MNWIRYMPSDFSNKDQSQLSVFLVLITCAKIPFLPQKRRVDFIHFGAAPDN
jgi:hypothetical protein